MAAASPDGTVLTGPSGQLVDSSGNVWTLASTPNFGQRIAVNGAVDPTTFFVTKLEYSGGKVYPENRDNNWWYKTSPTAAWTATFPPPSPHMTPSPEGAVITSPLGQIVDGSGDVYTLVSTPNYGQRIAINGTVDQTTYFVTELDYSGGKVYQENKNNNWWYKSAPNQTWVPTQAPATSNRPLAQRARRDLD